MADKTTYDVRISESNIERQLSFHKMAFFHMIFYRALILVSIITLFAFVLGIFYSAISSTIKYLIVIVWILFIPQVFSLTKGLCMIWSRGAAFGHLNKSYVNSLGNKNKLYVIYKILPYLVLGIWIAALCLFIFEEFL